jgi:uncharacterized DUF497 family protein
MDGKQKQFILSVARTVDPHYEDLYYELDMENGGRGLVRCENYEWDRAKSNANVREKDFSFYLARSIFLDSALTTLGKRRVVAGEERVKVAGHPFGIEDSSLLVVVEVALEGGSFHRIISSWENFSLFVEDQYNKKKASVKRLHQSFKPLSDEEKEWVGQVLRRHAWKTWKPKD